MKRLEVRDIVLAYLEANEYDGLYLPSICACTKDDLMPCCADGSQDCVPGYRGPCNSGEHGFHIGATRKDVESGECDIL